MTKVAKLKSARPVTVKAPALPAIVRGITTMPISYNGPNFNTVDYQAISDPDVSAAAKNTLVSFNPPIPQMDGQTGGSIETDPPPSPPVITSTGTTVVPTITPASTAGSGATVTFGTQTFAFDDETLIALAVIAAVLFFVWKK